jgi:hypothetical protein
MTIAIPTTSVLAEFTGGSSTEYDMMIGVGIQKDSDAVFFQYLGSDGESRALTVPTTGKPLNQFKAVRLANIEIAEDVGTFHATKLNVYLEGTGGTVVMVTSGLATMWSQCVMTALMGLMSDKYPDTITTESRFTLWSKKGDQGMRPCFASIFIDGERIGDDDMYTQLQDARSNRDKAAVESIMRDSVEILSTAINGTPAEIEVADEAILDAIPEIALTPDF